VTLGDAPAPLLWQCNPDFIAEPAQLPDHVLTSNKLVETVGRLWAQVLEKPADTGRSFFAQGGDSLRAMQLCARLSRELGAHVPVRLLFDAPQLEAFCTQLNGLAPDPDATLDSFLSGRLPPVLSYSQERMCFMHEIAIGSAAYHVPMAWRLTGNLDVSALRTAFSAVVASHEVLTMTVVADDDRLQPLYGSAPAPQIVQISLDARRDEDRQKQLENFLCEFANGPFHLHSGPLVRAALVQEDSASAVLVVVMHHVIADQWSLDVFFREMSLAYAGALAGRSPLAPGSRGKFTDYVSTHRGWFSEHRRDTELAYWRKKLRGLEVTALHEDFVRPAQQSFAGAKLRLDFGLREILALRQLGAAHDATLAMVLLTALKVLLCRHIGRSDIAVGVPVANRQHLDSEGLIGTLTNTLVLRTDLDGKPDFIGALSRVRTNLLDAFEHQDLPFDQLVRELDLQRDPSRPPLFSVMFNMLNTPLGTVQFPGLKWSRLEFDKKASQFDLTVTIDADHARSISFEYSPALFTPETIQRLADHYMELLRAALRDPAQRIDSVMLSPEGEQRQLREWALGPRLRRVAGTIPALLDSQFDRSGPHVAIRCADKILTYDELHQRIMQISDELAGLGIGRGSVVGLHLERSPQMVAAMLGVLYSGATYVPLDPSYPADRLAYMARDAELNLLLTDNVAGAEPAWPQGCRVLALNGLSDSAGTPPNGDLREGAHPGDPAYIIYTSGSTGEPKGVVVPHGAVVNILRSMLEQPGFNSNDRLLAVTTLSFDIAVLELLLPLTVGGQVVMATLPEQGDGDALRNLLERHHITVMQATPSTWQLMIDSGWIGTGELRAWAGGETLSRELANQLLGRCAEVWNMYGPTETTIWSACGRVDWPGRSRISLGRPIANTGIVVLDDNLEPCPVGVPGQICISGDGVAIGYLRRPELTAARFITNPRSRDRRTARIYCTGDLGRWRQDGQLEHLGRLDSQVKIRGFRIELGEIESRLLSHPEVEAAIVRVHSPPGFEPVLVAWVVPRAGMPGAPELREFLRQWLPEYMLPQHLLEIPAVPRLPNGKLDSQSLPPPGADPGHRGNPAPPSNAVELALWKIWRQALVVADFGIHDNLFDLGGHSLMAVQLVGRIRAELQRACNLAMLFRNPTIALLARALTQAEALPGATLVPLQSAGDGPELFCLGGIMIFRELAGRLAPDVPVCGVFVPQEMTFLAEGMDATTRTPDIPELAREYLETIRSRQPHGPYRLAGFSLGGVLAFEAAQQLRATGETVLIVIILDSDAPGTGQPGLLRRLKNWVRRRLARMSSTAANLAANARYVEVMRRYAPRRYPWKVLYVQSTDLPTHDPGYGWERLVPHLQALRVPDNHLGILQGKSVERVAAFLRPHLKSS
jgi:amino acid adenylation domain-containing protein